MKKYFVINLLILILVLSSGCQTSPETVTPFPVKTSAATLVPTATSEPIPTATEKVMTLEEKVDAFRSGKIDFPTGLTEEQYSAFIQEMNRQAGPRPIWFEDQGVRFYFDLQTNSFVSAPAGFPESTPELALENTPQTFFEVGEDAEGNLVIPGKDGTKVTVPNSANIPWNDVITDPRDPRIDWPTGPLIESGDHAGLTQVQAGMDSGNETEAAILPMILLDKNQVEIPIMDSGRLDKAPFFKMLLVETDTNGKPIFARLVFAEAKGVRMYKEETDGELISEPGFDRNPKAFKALQENSAYFIGLAKNQQKAWEINERATTNHLQGITSENNSFAIAGGELETSPETLLLIISFMILNN